MRPHKLNKKILPGFVEKKCVQSAKKTYKPAPSKHETPSPFGPFIPRNLNKDLLNFLGITKGTTTDFNYGCSAQIDVAQILGHLCAPMCYSRTQAVGFHYEMYGEISPSLPISSALSHFRFAAQFDIDISNRYSYEKIHIASLVRRHGLISALVTTSSPRLKARA